MRISQNQTIDEYSDIIDVRTSSSEKHFGVYSLLTVYRKWMMFAAFADDSALLPVGQNVKISLLKTYKEQVIKYTNAPRDGKLT